jgi:hypothetical protein
MKKRFLPLSLLLVIIILGQAMSFAGNRGKYVPRDKNSATAESYMTDLRANQNTGLIDPALMIKASKEVCSSSKEGDLYWINIGPDNFGGQTTAVLYDNRNSNVIYIGSKGGGVFKTYNKGITWHRVGNANLMVSCMVQAEDGTIYVGTGDGSNAATYNGLSDISYSNSFIGSGIYTIVDDVVAQIPSTAPSVLNNVAEWSFVNDIAVSGDMLLAATEEGLKYSNDKGETWAIAKADDGSDIEGSVMQVKVASDGKIIASVAGAVYVGTVDAMVNRSTDEVNEEGVIVGIPVAASIADVAVAPSDPNTIYASLINASGVHTSIYVSNDQGATWRVALPSITSAYGHNIYEGFGLYNHGLVVHPEDASRVFVMGYNLWELKRPSGNGYYMSIKQSEGTATSIYSNYLHVGLHCMVFNPNNSNECFIGTDGGVSMGEGSSSYFTYTNCNRNYITTRFFSVAASGSLTRVLGGAIDHGTILINGIESQNTLMQGDQIYPVGNEGAFSASYHGGPCAISVVNPDAVFVTAVDAGIARSESAGADYDFANFTANYTPSYNSFRMPMVLWESFDDDSNPLTVWFKANRHYNAGETVTCFSNNFNYPFSHTLESQLNENDSIEIQDPVCSKLFVAVSDAIYYTREALDFSTKPVWWKLSEPSLGFDGDPLSMAVSADADNVFVGMKDGTLTRISNLRAAVDSLTTYYMDSSSFAPQTTVISLTDASGAEISQAITSIAIDPRNANNVVVTLGNYGNESYVYYSTNALSSEPTFTVKQGNLPLMPIYSSLIEMETGKVILGTEHGIYMTSDINASNPTWNSQSQVMGDIPVTDLKQQLLYKEATNVYSADSSIVLASYAGVKNQGAIYAATYGRGLFRCENFLQNIGTGVADNAEVEQANVVMYPNPVRSEAKVSFEISESKSMVAYQVYDMSGRLVKSEVLGSYSQGSYEVGVSMSDLSSGAYLFRLNEGSRSQVLKFMVY